MAHRAAAQLDTTVTRAHAPDRHARQRLQEAQAGCCSIALGWSHPTVWGKPSGHGTANSDGRPRRAPPESHIRGALPAGRSRLGPDGGMEPVPSDAYAWMAMGEIVDDTRRVARTLRGDRRIRAACVLGSVARGERDEHSDVDLLIVIPDGSEDDVARSARNELPHRIAGSRVQARVLTAGRLAAVRETRTVYAAHVGTEALVLFDRKNDLRDLRRAFPRGSTVAESGEALRRRLMLYEDLAWCNGHYLACFAVVFGWQDAREGWVYHQLVRRANRIERLFQHRLQALDLPYDPYPSRRLQSELESYEFGPLGMIPKFRPRRLQQTVSTPVAVTYVAPVLLAAGAAFIV